MPVAIVAGLAALAAALSAPASAPAAFPGANGEIAFDTLRYDFLPHVVTIDQDGNGFTDLTAAGGSESFPSWSPDGARIAYSADLAGDGSTELFSMNADGSARTRLTTTPTVQEFKSDWSPDGTRLVVSGTTDTDPVLFTLNADGSGATALIAGVDPAWSPDGTRIAFARHDGLDYELFTIRPDGSGLTQLTDNVSGDFTPDWSPDATRLVYVATGNGNPEVHVVNADGLGQTNITNDPGSDLAPSWSPDGSRIAFSSDRASIDSFSLYTMPPDGSGPSRITTGRADDVFPPYDQNSDWQPVGALANYPRPGGASPLRVPLVPAFAACSEASANSVHLPPLAFPSCTPPALRSGLLTVSKTGQASGFLKLVVQPGDPQTPADEADVAIDVSGSDVRNAADGSDYGGSLLLALTLRLTDRGSGFGGVAATLVDATLSLPVGCTATPGTAGSTCATTTTADTLVPGLIVEQRRTIASAAAIAVTDAGPDGDLGQASPSCPLSCGTGDESDFLEPGLFLP